MSDEDLVEEEQWRITDKGRDFLKAQRDAAQSKAQLIRLTRFEAFTEAAQLVSLARSISEAVSGIEELRLAAKPRSKRED
jgi:hypothetical protein